MADPLFPPPGVPQPVDVQTSAPAPGPSVPQPTTRYTGPSALDEIMAKTDPRVGAVYRANGFPDLPRYVSQLGAGAVEAASLGFLKAPQEPETTPERLLRGAGQMLGASFIPLGPVVKTAGRLGINRVVAGAGANMLATEVATRGDASLARLLVDGTFGAIFGKFYGAPKEPRAGLGNAVLKEPGSTLAVPPDLASKSVRSFKQMARFHKDPEIREYAKRLTRFWDSVDPGDVNINDLKKAWQESTSGVADTKLIGMEHTLEGLLATEGKNASEPLLRDVQTGITKIGSALRPPKMVLADVQQKSGGRIKAFDEAFLPATAARQAASNEIGMVGKEVSDQLKGVKKEKLQAMLQYLQTPLSRRDLGAQALFLSKEEQDKALSVGKAIGGLWERNFGEPFDEYLTGVLPRLANASPQQLENLRNHRTAGEMLKYAAGAELRLNTTDLGKFAAGHIRALSLMHHFDPTYRKIAAMAANQDLPKEYQGYLTSWLEGLRGTSSSFAKAYNPVYKKFLGSMGIDASDADVRNVLNTYNSLTHAGLIGFRPGPLIRNLFNTWQTGSRIGAKWTWEGTKMALTRQGREIARRGGMLEEEVLHEVTGLRELGQAGRITRGAEKIAEAGLRPYGKVDDFNRSAMYLGMREKFLTAAKGAGKNETALLKKAGLYRFHPVVRDHVLSSWRTGNLAEAAHLAGAHAAQDTQWVYQSGFRPTAMSGELNKAFLQFGVWPMNYMEYMRQMVRPLVGADPHTPAIESAKWMAEWALMNAGIVGVMGAAGASVGLGPDAIYHTLKWTFAGPLAYTGGPLFDTVKAAESLASGSGGQAAASAKRTIKGTLISTVPGSGLVRDVARAKGTGAEMLQEALGEDMLKTLDMGYSKLGQSEDAGQELFRFMTGVKPEGRAMGGPVVANKPYLVGEQGPELIVPTTPGTVIPGPMSQQDLIRSWFTARLRQPTQLPDDPGVGIGISGPPGRGSFRGPGPGGTTHYAPGTAPLSDEEKQNIRNIAAQYAAARAAHRQQMLDAVRRFPVESRQQYKQEFWQKVPSYGWKFSPPLHTDEQGFLQWLGYHHGGVRGKKARI